MEAHTEQGSPESLVGAAVEQSGAQEGTLAAPTSSQNPVENDPPINTIQPVAGRSRQLSSPPFGEDVPTMSRFAQSASDALGQATSLDSDWPSDFDPMASNNTPTRMYGQDGFVQNLNPSYDALPSLPAQVNLNRLLPLDRSRQGNVHHPTRFNSPNLYPGSPIYGAGHLVSSGHNTRQSIPISPGSSSPRIGRNVTTRFASYSSLQSPEYSNHPLPYGTNLTHERLASSSHLLHDRFGPPIMEPSPSNFSPRLGGQEKALLFQDFANSSNSFGADARSGRSTSVRDSDITHNTGEMQIERSHATTDVVPTSEEVFGIRRIVRSTDPVEDEQGLEPVQPMRFRSIRQAEEASRSHVSRHFIPVFDESYPETDQDEYRYAVQLFNAMLNTEDAEDNEKMKIQWIRTTEQTPEAVEAAAWRALKRTMDYYKQPGFLRNRHPYPATLKKFEVFSEHINCVSEALRLNKTICRHFLGSSYMDGTIDDPNSAVNRVKNNRKVNAEKRSKKEKLEQKIAALKTLDTVQQTSRSEIAAEVADEEEVPTGSRKRSRLE